MMLVYIIATSLSYALITYLNSYTNRVIAPLYIGLSAVLWLIIFGLAPKEIAIAIIIPVVLIWLQELVHTYFAANRIDHESAIHKQYMKVNMYINFIFVIHQIAIVAHYVATL